MIFWLIRNINKRYRKTQKHTSFQRSKPFADIPLYWLVYIGIFKIAYEIIPILLGNIVFASPQKTAKNHVFFVSTSSKSRAHCFNFFVLCSKPQVQGTPDGSWDHMLIERLIFPINPVWLMVRKSGKLNSWGLVVEISLFTKVLIHPRWLFGISEPSTVSIWVLPKH